MTPETWQFSCTRMTVLVKTNERGLIVDTAQITKIFVGQPLMSLEVWMRKFGKFKKTRLNTP